MNYDPVCQKLQAAAFFGKYMQYVLPAILGIADVLVYFPKVWSEFLKNQSSLATSNLKGCGIELPVLSMMHHVFS